MENREPVDPQNPDFGRMKIYFQIDGDLPGGMVGRNVREHGGTCDATICGTGTENYFCGSYNFENNKTKEYKEYTTANAGLPHIVRPDGTYHGNTRFSLYRWHLVDPIRFQSDLAVIIQALGWRSGHCYLPLRDDIASTAFWYQTLPTASFPPLPDADALEIN